MKSINHDTFLMHAILSRYLEMLSFKTAEKVKEGIEKNISRELRNSFLMENRYLCSVPIKEIEQDRIKDIVQYFAKNHKKMGLIKCHKKFEPASYIPADEWVMENLLSDITNRTFLTYEAIADAIILDKQKNND